MANLDDFVEVPEGLEAVEERVEVHFRTLLGYAPRP
jgi:hypothetical protein